MIVLILGDRVVASHEENQQWTVPQNKTQTLTYPKNGIGANVTYVEIIVDQVIHSSTNHKVFEIMQIMMLINRVQIWVAAMLPAAELVNGKFPLRSKLI